MGIEQTGRTLELGDNDPLGAVDHEYPIRSHQGQGAKEHLLFLDIPDRLDAGLLIHIKGDQPYHNFEWYLKCHAPLLAFLNGIFRFSKLISDKFQRTDAIEVIDRKNFLEYGLEPDILALIGIGIHLQKMLIGLSLH